MKGYASPESWHMDTRSIWDQQEVCILQGSEGFKELVMNVWSRFFSLERQNRPDFNLNVDFDLKKQLLSGAKVL